MEMGSSHSCSKQMSRAKTAATSPSSRLPPKNTAKPPAARTLPTKLRHRSGLMAAMARSSPGSSSGETSPAQQRRERLLYCSSFTKSVPPATVTRRVWVSSSPAGVAMVTMMAEVMTKTFMWLAPQARPMRVMVSSAGDLRAGDQHGRRHIQEVCQKGGSGCLLFHRVDPLMNSFAGNAGGWGHPPLPGAYKRGGRRAEVVPPHGSIVRHRRGRCPHRPAGKPCFDLLQLLQLALPQCPFGIAGHAPRRHKLHITRFRLRRKLAHFAAPPFPTVKGTLPRGPR